jgi:hypothetical protein
VKKEGDKELIDLIRRIQERHHYRYGSSRVRETLRRDCGKRASRKKVARLMREYGLNARFFGWERERTEVHPRSRFEPQASSL